MSYWTYTAGVGSWMEPGFWLGGVVPNGLGAIASIGYHGGSGGYPSDDSIVRIPEGQTVKLSYLDINQQRYGHIVAIEGTSGGQVERLVLEKGWVNGLGEYGQILVHGYGQFELGGPELQIELATEIKFVASSIFIINGIATPGVAGLYNVVGAGALVKAGDSRLFLGGTNTFSGGIRVTAGTLEYDGDRAIGSGSIQISNNAVFLGAIPSSTSQIVDNSISTIANASGVAGSARIAANSLSTLSLTGTLSHVSQGTLSFGNTIFDYLNQSFRQSNETYLVRFAEIHENATNSSFSITNGTLKFGNFYNADNLFRHPGTGLTTIEAFGTLDTNGFAAMVNNLDLNGGTIRSSVGALNLTVEDVTGSAIAQNGTIIGTTSSDTLLIFTQTDFNLTGITFTTWSSNDYIQLVGNSANNALTGSNLNDVINGDDGSDTLVGAGGVDTISAGPGNDLIILSSSNSHSSVYGDAGTDSLRILGGSLTLNAILGCEAIELAGGSALTLTGTQVSGGFATSTVVTGSGSLTINMTAGLGLLTKVYNFTGFTGSFTVNGTSGTDVVKLGNAANTVNLGDGLDVVQGGSLVDTINGGAGVDKIAGNGGADLLTGGTGNDVFKYRAVSDSGLGAAADRITDFVIGQDRINFVNIDSNAGLAGMQGFNFIGTAAFANNGLGQVRYLTSGSNLVVQADVNGDGAADMEIILQGLAGQTLTSAQFVLGTPPAMEPPSAKGIGSGVDVLPPLASAKGGGAVQSFESFAETTQFEPQAWLHDARFSVWGFVAEPWLI